MKKILFLALIIIIGYSCYSQNSNSDQIIYKADGVYIVFLDNTGKEVNKKPLGKNPYIFYDKFFKSYSIWFTDENGESLRDDYSFIDNEKDGTIRMSDHQGSVYLLSDKITEKGILCFTRTKQTDGYIVLILVEGIVLNKP